MAEVARGSMREAERYRIGELASSVRLNPRTIRYYERVGLLPEPARTRAGYRLYDERDVARLDFIIKAKGIGLTLAEIGEILSLRDDGQPPCEHVLSLLERKVAAIDEQLRTLQEMRAELTALQAGAAADPSCQGTICGLIEGYRPHCDNANPGD